MAVIALEDLEGAVGRGRPLMGVDHGERTLGLAISDTTWTIASPLSSLTRTRFTVDAGRVFSLMDERGAAGLIIGLPVNMDGSQGVACQKARAFASNLLRLRGLAIAFWDERLSTEAVNRMLIGKADLSRRRRAQVVDRAAAAWILQGALDFLRRSQGAPTTDL